ncbi:hypothetical protein B0H14DRAFT_2829534 [Mycena olivaceomarginata]|nr:hypothetical protein B0H14DRAFT_2829534 [Mycena olivaceomarginata]
MALLLTSVAHCAHGVWRMRVCCLPSVAVCGLPCSAQSILRSTTMAVYPEETRRTRYGAWASSVCVFFFLLFSFESWWMLRARPPRRTLADAMFRGAATQNGFAGARVSLSLSRRPGMMRDERRTTLLTLSCHVWSSSRGFCSAQEPISAE